ncbi:acyl carrier protein [Sinosporangium album]|uniref:acyl carrier protein n=1 Tax=Sinosporangium album TaxID=504805 RepID=UPI0015A371D7|nr:acyl carrier protein [Sinosporangium album]
MSDASNEVVEVVAREMGKILTAPPLGSSDDFFLCGGDSLRAVELISRITSRYQPVTSEGESALGSELLLAIFDEATPRGIAAIVERHIEARNH